MSILPPQPTRRERLRAQTLEEIRGHAYAQIAAGGAAALSLNGIAKSMGMSGAALYRYFASREELLGTLIIESYEALAGALADARDAARRRGPEGRFLAVADAYRAWALAQPARYRLVFQSALSDRTAEPERIVGASQQAMDVILAALADLAPSGGVAGDQPRTATARPVIPAGLSRDLGRWGAGTGLPGAAAELYLWAQLSWSRLHGIISLEIEGVYAQMGVDPGAIYAHEVRTLLASGPSPT